MPQSAHTVTEAWSRECWLAGRKPGRLSILGGDNPSTADPLMVFKDLLQINTLRERLKEYSFLRPEIKAIYIVPGFSDHS